MYVKTNIKTEESHRKLGSKNISSAYIKNNKYIKICFITNAYKT